MIFLFAVIVGIAVGLLPGIGLFSAMVILYPILIAFSPTDILVFYAVMGGASQFSGSITACIIGAAGEPSSIPATKEGPLLFARGKGSLAISTAAIGSFIGTLIVTVVLLVSIDSITKTIEAFYNNNVQTALFISVLGIIVLAGNNKLIVNILYVIVGAALANIGFQRYSSGPLTFGIPAFSNGISFVALAIGLYSLPQIITTFSNFKEFTIEKNSPIANFKESINAIKTNIGSVLRGSVIGMLAGLVPGLTTILASNLSYTVEKILRKFNRSYNSNGDLACLISAETANNSGLLTSMLPLMIFGIPIIGSEVVVLNLIEKSGTNVGLNTLLQGGIFQTVALYFLLGGAISMVIAWQGANLLSKIYSIPKNILLYSIIVISTIAVYITGAEANNQLFDMICFAVCLSIGCLLKKTDTSVIIFSFLIYPFLEYSVLRFISIHYS